MNRTILTRLQVCGSLLGLVAFGPVERVLAVSPVPGLRTVALAGAPAPGAGAGVTFHGFYDSDQTELTPAPIVNKLGQVAFMPQLSSFVQDGDFQFFDHAIYSEGSGSLSLIAKQRGQAAGVSTGVQYLNFLGLAFNDNGSVAYPANYMTGNGDNGIYSNRTGANVLLARQGQQAIGYPSGVKYGLLLPPKLNNSGKIAFGTFPSNAGSTSSGIGAIYSDVGNATFQLIARSGDPAPGIPGSTYGIVGSDYWLNNAGEIVFPSTLNDNTDSFALWTKKPGAPVTLALRSDAPAPGLPGLTYSGFNCCISAAGADTIAFGGRLAGPGVVDNNNDALFYTGTNGTVALLAREGQPAFGSVPAGAVFGRINPSIAPINTFLAAKTNTHGDYLFRADMRGGGVGETNDSGLWYGNATGGFRLIAREGTSTGAPAGSTTQTIQDTVLNDLGQFAYLSTFSTPSSFYTALMATDTSGNLTEIARTGSQIDVDNGPGVDLRTISGFFNYQDFFNPDENLIGISPRGHIAFRAQFTDGTSALFVSSLVAVPEPSSIALASFALLGLFTARRSRREAS